MANQLLMPDMLGAVNRGVEYGKQNRLARLAGEAYSAAPDQRRGLIGEMVGIDPRAGLAMGNTLQAQEQAQEADHQQKLAQAASFMLKAKQSGNPQAVQGAWSAVRPYLSQLTGQQAPEQFDENMWPAVYQAAAQSGADMPQPAKPISVGAGETLLNPSTYQPVYQAPEKKPNSIRELEYLQEHPDLAQFDQQRRMASRPVTNINTGRQENAFQTAVGKADAGEYVKWRDNAIQANNTLAQADQIEQIMNAQETGKVQEALALAGQYFGTDAGSSLQAMKAAIQPLVLANVKQLGSGTGISDADRKFIEAGMPGFGNTPKANARVLRIMRMVAERKIDLFNNADKYVKQHGSLQGFTSPYISGNPAPTNDSGDINELLSKYGVK